MCANLSDSELIVLWQSGADHAFEILYKRYAVQLLALALSKTSDREIAEEIIQDAFLSLFLKKQTADTIYNLSAFLYTTVKHKIIDHYRREKSLKQFFEHSQHHLTDIDNSTSQGIELRDMEAHIAVQVDGLPNKCKNVFVLSRTHHMTNKQIATQLEISENTVEQHIRKAIRLLRASVIENGHVITILACWAVQFSYYIF